jgi:hypothetical protein
MRALAFTTLAAVTSIFCVIAHADSLDRKVAGKVPLAHFSSARNGSFTSNDLVRIIIFREHPTMAAITNWTAVDFQAPGLAPVVGRASRAVEQIIARTSDPAPYPARLLTDSDIEVKGKIPLPKFLEPLRIRKSWDQLANAEFDEVEAAKISFNRNFLDSESTLKANGVVGYDFSKSSTSLVREYHLIPNIAFDRVRGDEKGDVDSLNFRFAISAELAPKNASLPIESHLVRVAPLYASDFGLRSGQVGGEVEWEPIGSKIWLGELKVLPTGQKELFTVLPRAFVHFEGLSVLDAGSNTNLVKGFEYFRLGPVVELKFGFGRDAQEYLQKLNFPVSWRQYEALSDDTKETRLLTAGATYELFKNVTLEAEYKKGRTPLTAEKVESFEVGLGLKF